MIDLLCGAWMILDMLLGRSRLWKSAGKGVRDLVR
jgi:hypothetical protein